MKGRYAYSGWREAYEAFARAVSIDPDYPLANAYYAVATAIMGAADAETVARKALDIAVAQAPDSPDVLFAEGFVEGAFGQGDAAAERRALTFYDRAIAIDPSHSEALHARIRYLDKPEDALQAFERLIAVDPLFVNARLNYATRLAQAGRWEDADAQFEQIFQIRPEIGHGGALDIAREAGRTDLIGKYAFGNLTPDILGRPDGFAAAALLADFGANDEASFLMSQRDLTGFFFLPRQQEIFIKWTNGEFSEAARTAVVGNKGDGYGAAHIFSAIVAIMGRDAGGAIAFIRQFDPSVPDWDARKIASVEEVPYRMAVRVYAMALVLMGEDKAAQKYFDALIATSAAEDQQDSQQTYHILRAADFAWSGRHREAIAEVRNARAAGWRYPRTYVVEFSPWPPIDGPYGLLSPLADEPEFKAIMKEIRSENAALLEKYEAQYGALSKVRAMMKADASPR